MRRRKTYFVKKRFQTIFILCFSLLIIIESLVIGVLLYYSLYKGLNEVIYRSHIKIKTTGEVMAPILINVNTAVAIMVILMAIILALIIMRRVEYSLNTFYNAAKRIGEGDLACKIDDQTHILTGELAYSFNGMAEGIKRKVDILRSDLEVIEEKIRILDERLKEGIHTKESLRENLHSFARATDRFEEELRRFKV